MGEGGIKIGQKNSDVFYGRPQLLISFLDFPIFIRLVICFIIIYRTWVRVEGEKRYNPWAQPGTAPIYGEGCGLNGGNPNGCQGDYEDSNPFGTCCGGTPTSKLS